MSRYHQALTRNTRERCRPIEAALEVARPPEDLSATPRWHPCGVKPHSTALTGL
jgi:hypothetical protein